MADDLEVEEEQLLGCLHRPQCLLAGVALAVAEAPLVVVAQVLLVLYPACRMLSVSETVNLAECHSGSCVCNCY